MCVCACIHTGNFIGRLPQGLLLCAVCCLSNDPTFQQTKYAAQSILLLASCAIIIVVLCLSLFRYHGDRDKHTQFRVGRVGPCLTTIRLINYTRRIFGSWILFMESDKQDGFLRHVQVPLLSSRA